MNPGLRPHAALLAMLGFLIPLAAHAQSGDPDPERFTEEIDAFARWDAKNAPPDDPIVFVGSSSIRFWNTAERFPLLPIVNRGFGGAHISDVNHFLEQTVLRYAPSIIVFYAGDNDIGENGVVITDLQNYPLTFFLVACVAHWECIQGCYRCVRVRNLKRSKGVGFGAGL